MECIILGELIDISVGVVIIGTFFSKRFPVMHHSPFSLVIGILFVVDSSLEIILNKPVGILEFTGALILLILLEKFISENTGTKFNHFSPLLPLILTILVILIERDNRFFHFGTLMILSVMALRTGQGARIIGWYYRDVFFISSLFGLFGALSFLFNFPMGSDFFYFGGVLLYILTIGEILRISH